MIFSVENTIFNNRGIDTVRQVAHYSTLKNIIVKHGLTIRTELKNLPINPYLASIEQSLKNDPKNRYKKEAFKPIIEYVKISQGSGLSNYIIIIKNIPLLFEHALAHKKAKDTFCLVVYTGLHQPTKHISNEAVKLISKLLKRKTFTLLNCDVATDYKDAKNIDYKRKEEFKSRLGEVCDNSYIIKQNSLYCNQTTLKGVDKILLYDKYKKQTAHQKQRLHASLKEWKRLEITLTPKGKTDFMSFIKTELDEAIQKADVIAKGLRTAGFKDDYLLYQIKALTDARTLNKKPATARFNSKQALESFIVSRRRKSLAQTDDF